MTTGNRRFFDTACYGILRYSSEMFIGKLGTEDVRRLNSLATAEQGNGLSLKQITFCARRRRNQSCFWLYPDEFKKAH